MSFFIWCFHKLNTLPKRLWAGWVVYGLIFISTLLRINADQVSYGLLGLALGAFFQWSLYRSVQNPAGKWQALGSLIRMAGVSGVIVWLGGGDLAKTTIVILGFLSYKGGALVEALYQCASCTLELPPRKP